MNARMFWQTIIFGFYGFKICYAADLVVSAPSGQYEGSIFPSKTPFGQSIFSFRGIRYAEAPINELRFKPAVPSKKQQGIINAKEDAPACPQPGFAPTSEDCLFLNVYTNKLPENNEALKRPVIVYIHQGAFQNSTGRSNWVGPEYIMTQDIVLVTFNYRLGVLGFLSTGDKEAPGNNGFKDQVLALKWVKENIGAFGGSKDNVTIFGYASGGLSVSLHLVSPMSKGLFHKAVVSIRSVLGRGHFGTHQLDVAKKVAGILGCPTDTSANMIQCMRSKSAAELGNLSTKLTEFAIYPIPFWRPVIEKDFGQERFLTDNPIKLLRENKFHKVPILSGIPSDAMAVRAFDLVRNAGLLHQLDEQWDKYAPIIFNYERDTDRSKMISKELRSFYFGDRKLDGSIACNLTRLLNDAHGGYSVNKGVKLLSEKCKSHVYYYRFSYKPKPGSKFLAPENQQPCIQGASYYEDLNYIFRYAIEFPAIEKTDPEFRAVTRLTTILGNFARTGQPIPETCGKFDFANWEPYNLKTRKYLDIGEMVELKEKLHHDRYALWEKLFPLSYVETISESNGSY